MLRAKFPQTPLVRDVRKLKSLPPKTDLIASGFPCQDLSQAGTTAGIWGAQSGLVWEVFRLVRKSKPEYLLFENVPFMLRLNKGEAISLIVRRLEQLGYKWAYRVIDAQAFGVPQRRPRVFILACRHVDPRKILLCQNASEPRARRTGTYGFYWTEGNTGIGLAKDALPALKGGSALGIPSPPAIAIKKSGIFTPHLSDAERLQGFPPHWTAAAVNGSKSKHRWRLIGNSVNVRVAAWLGRRLRHPLSYRARGDEPLGGGTWPEAAYNVGQGRFESTAGPFPVQRKHRSLRRFLRFPPKPLSARASKGILSRLERSSLRAGDILIRRLKDHIRARAA